MANGSNSQLPEIGGARGFASNAGSASGTSPSGSAPRPSLSTSTPTTRYVVPGGELSTLLGDSGHDDDPSQMTSSSRLGPRRGSPRDSTAQGGVAPILGFLGSPASTHPLLPRRRQELETLADAGGVRSSPSEGEITFPDSSTPLQSSSTSADILGRQQAYQGRAQADPIRRRRRRFLEFPPTPPVSTVLSLPDGSSIGDASTLAPSSSTAAGPYMLGSPRDGQAGAEPTRRRRGFADSTRTPHVVREAIFPGGPSFRAASTAAQSPSAPVGAEPNPRLRGFADSPPTREVIFPGDPSFCDTYTSTPAQSTSTTAVGPETNSRDIAAPNVRAVPATWVVWTTGLEGGITAGDARAIDSLVGRLRRELGSGGAAPGLWRFSFEYDAAAAIPSWRLVVQHQDQIVASWRVDVDDGNHRGVRSTAAAIHAGGVPIPSPTSSGSTTALGAHGQQFSSMPMVALGSPAGRRRSRWDVPSRTCHSCRGGPVAWFLPCCAHLLCGACVRSGAGCSCRDLNLMRRPVPFRPPYEPQPLRSLVYLRYPLWQMFYVAETADLVVIAYYNADEAFYSQSEEVNFRMHMFYMEGERWTRCFEVSFTLPCHDAELRLFVREVDAAPDAAADPYVVGNLG